MTEENVKCKGNTAFFKAIKKKDCKTMEEIYDGSCAGHQFCCGEFGEAGHNPSETMADVRQGALKLKDKKSISQRSGLAAFIKEARKNRIWRYATSMLAVLVVFVTAYVLIVPGITLTVSELDPTLPVASMEVTNAVYDDEEYTADFYITLADIKKSDVNSTTKYYVVLPEDVTLVGYSGSTLTGYDDSGAAAFTYVYDYDDGVLYAEVTFLESYLTSAGDTLTGGWFKYEAEISSKYIDDEYNIVLNYGGLEYKVDFNNITMKSDDNNPLGDLTVSKSTSGYDKSTNSITYTLTVKSTKGTVGNISLVDTITSTIGVSNVEDISVQYYYTTDAWNGTSSAEDVTSTIVSQSYSDGVLKIELPALTSGVGYGSTYVVQYTVSLSDITDYSATNTVDNSVVASAETGWTGNGGGEVTSTAQASKVTISFNLLSKTGTADADGNITWTITVNESGVNICGLSLTDSMFSNFQYNDLVAAITGGTAQGQDYLFVYDNSGNISGIQFVDNITNTNTNTNTYTITYTTGASATWASGTTITKNTAILSGDNVGSGISVGPSVSTSSGGISKSKDGVSSNGDGTVNITWTIKGTIPSGGISEGTTLYDYLGGSSAYTTKTTQWFTYDQVKAMLSSLTSITLDGSNTTLSHGPNADYIVEFYSAETGEWIEIQDLYDSKYSSYYFTAFRIIFQKDITVSNSCSFSLTYTTTADRSSVDDYTVTSLTYTNNVEVKGESTLSAEASHTEGAYVIKTDGNGKTGSSTTTVGSDGTLTWIVKAYVPAGCTDTYYTVTDTLPENVTLTSARLAVSWYTCTLTSDTLSGTLYNGTVTGEIGTNSNGQQTVTITIPYDSYSLLVDSGDYITITYTCKIADSLLTTTGTEENGTVELESGASVGTFSNSVSVATSSNASFGSTSQEQTVTYSSSGGTEETTQVSKSYVWNSDSSTLTYTVIINPDAETLANGNDLSFEDTLTANHATTWGVYAQLVTASVKFYEAVSDGEGGYTKGDVLSIPWTYSQSSADTGSYISVYHTITSSSVPDATTIILEYQYEAWLDPYVDGESYNITGIGNSMTLEGKYTDSTSSSNSDVYTDSHFSAGIGNLKEVNITIVKVDSENYSTTLADAVYTLYKWSGSEWTSLGTYTTDSNGMISIGKTTLGSNYETDTGYKLVETTAPKGYLLDSDTEYYFYWSGSGTDCYPDDWESASAHNLTKSSATEYAENTKVPDDTTTSVSVNKEWVDTTGTTLDDSKVEATSVEVTLYRYEESDLEDEEFTESEEDDSNKEKINIYVHNGSWFSINNEPAETLTVNKGEEVTLLISDDSASLNEWYLYASDGSTTLDYNWSLGGASSCEVTIAAENTESNVYLYIKNSPSCYVSVKGEERTSISGVNSSGLPHDSNGDFAGEEIGTYTITKAEGWTLTVDGLTYQYYDEDTKLHTYYYYFVETAVDGYYTTYSSSLGTTDGGSLTITNTKIPTTSIEVEKQWLDTDGSELTSDDKGYTYMTKSISVDLYRTEEVVDDSGSSSGDSDTVSLSVICSRYGTSTTLVEDNSIPRGTTVTVYFGYEWISYAAISGEINGDTTSFTSNYYVFVIDTDTTITLTSDNADTFQGTEISYSGQGLASGGNTTTTYSGADLPTDGTYVGTYTIEPDADGDWNLSISNLPGGYVDDEGTLHNYYYYVRESSDDLLYFDTTYSSSSAISDGTLTIYNTYNPNLEYTEARVEKIWLDSTSTEISDLSSYSATFQLIQVLQVTDNSTNSGYVETDGSILMIPYRSPMTLTDSSSTWAGRWVNLPTTASYGGVTYTCVYFITETNATDGTDTTTFDVVAGTSTEDGSDSYTTITVDGVTYYAVTVGNTSVELLSSSYVPTVKITNTSSEEEKDSTSITVTKEWANVSDVDLNGYTVTFQLVQLLKNTDDNTYYKSNDDITTDYSTEDVDGKKIKYSYDMSITDSNSESYTWSSLPVTVTIGSVTYTCEYYIIESAVKDSSGDSVADQYTVSYSNSSATTYTDADNLTYYQVTNGGTATVTNTYTKEEETTISFNVIKNWEENGSSLQVSEVTLTVQLLQVLKADGYVPLYNQSDASDIDYTQTITFTNSSTDEVTWSGLPATMTVDGVKYTCSYYIVEASVVNGSDTPVADLYTVAYTNGDVDATSYEYTDTSSNETTTYYAVSDGETITITNTAKNTAVLPSTGGSGNSGKLVLLGSSIALLALMLILARRRKREVVG